MRARTFHRIIGQCNRRVIVLRHLKAHTFYMVQQKSFHRTLTLNNKLLALCLGIIGHPQLSTDVQRVTTKCSGNAQLSTEMDKSIIF